MIFMYTITKENRSFSAHDDSYGHSVYFQEKNIKILLKITKKCVTNGNIYFIMKAPIQFMIIFVNSLKMSFL